MKFFESLKQKFLFVKALRNPREKGSSQILFEGGNGNSPEDAIVIRGARFDLVGSAAIFQWLIATFGQMDRDWRLISQSHLHLGERDFDRFELIELPFGNQRTIFFDITEHFGRFPDE